MSNTTRMKILITLIAVTGTILISHLGTPAQTAHKPTTWEDTLFAEDIKYDEFACNATQRTSVEAFFKANPLGSVLRRVCHNNCAILRSFPGDLPPLDKKLLGTGSLAIHVLVDENGKPLYSRTLNGRQPARSLFQKRACEATFGSAEGKRQTVLFICMGSCEPQPAQ